MNCGETREYVFAFLDSELETPLSIDLQLHLDGCPDCAREAEIERAIHKRLDHMMDSAVPAFAGRLAGSITGWAWSKGRWFAGSLRGPLSG